MSDKDDDPIKLFVVTEIDDEGDLMAASIHTTRDGAEAKVRALKEENKASGRDYAYFQRIDEAEVEP